MRHIIFDESNTSNRFPIALLIKDSAFNKSELQNSYISELEKQGISADQTIGFTLDYAENGKVSVKTIKSYLNKLMPILKSMGCEYLYCADAAYFKVLAGQRKAEPHLGYILPCAIAGFEDMKVILGVNHKSLLYNPANESKLLMSINTLIKSQQGNYKPLGDNIIKFCEYPETDEDIEKWLQTIKDYPLLAVDIEAASLRFEQAGIATITFCWNKHEGIAFPVDYQELPTQDEKGNYGKMVHNTKRKQLLKEFFESYTGSLVFHKCTYDTKVLIYELWMKALLDTEGLLTGLDCLYRNIHDTRVIAYLATNTTAGNNLGLKDLAHSFAGNWAQEEIKNILKIPLSKLLQYNLVDGLSTHYVFAKYSPIMIKDDQEEIYTSLMMPSQKVITQIELTGMPIFMDKVVAVKKELKTIANKHLEVILNSPATKQAERIIAENAWKKDYEDRKSKAKNPDKIFPKDKQIFLGKPLNPNSGKQLQILLYEVMKLPVIDLTDTKQPATGGDTLEKLINHTTDTDYQKVITAIMEYGEAQKILSTFIPAFENSLKKEDGHHYLHGSFNLGGTKSGRLSSSEPNLQNLPSGSTYGKLIKECFGAAEGELYGGADFNSLEDYISALTTKDPNKLKVYVGHEVYGLKTPENSQIIRDDTIIRYQGKEYTCEQFYKAFGSL